MVARTNAPLGLSQEEEVARYNEMDAERDARCVESRLVEPHELPEWLHRAEALLNERKLAPDTDAELLAPRERKQATPAE